MRSLLLVGGGGHCHACIDVIETECRFRIVGVVQQKTPSRPVLDYPVVGSDDDLPELIKKSKLVLIVVGQIKSAEIRVKLFDHLKCLGAEFPVIISPRAYRSKHTSVGDGSIIMHGAVVNAGVQIGNNCIINSQSLVEHDVTIGEHCHISTGAILNGNVNIGSRTFIGSGAVVKEGVSIGNNVIVGAGQIITNDIASGVVVKNG